MNTEAPLVVGDRVRVNATSPLARGKIGTITALDRFAFDCVVSLDGFHYRGNTGTLFAFSELDKIAEDEEGEE